MSPLPRFRLWTFLFLLIALPVSWCARDQYKSVSEILPETVPAPVQTPIRDGAPIQFSREGYAFTLTPLFDYTLTGLVLSAQEYDRWFSRSRTDRSFTKDLCVLWGKTLQSKVYQDSAFAVEQDMRWCFFRFQRALPFDATERSNNHLIAATSGLRRQIGAIHGGDQVRITGKLVNVRAVATQPVGPSDSPALEWKTSTKRGGDGAGACEIIYVERVEMLRRGNRLWHLLFSSSLFGVVLLGAWAIVQTIVEIVRLERSVPAPPRVRS